MTVDVSKQTWRMAVDNVQNDQEFGFRYNASSLEAIDFLVEGQQQIYIDAIRILSPDAE